MLILIGMLSNAELYVHLATSSSISITYALPCSDTLPRQCDSYSRRDNHNPRLSHGARTLEVLSRHFVSTMPNSMTRYPNVCLWSSDSHYQDQQTNKPFCNHQDSGVSDCHEIVRSESHNGSHTKENPTSHLTSWLLSRMSFMAPRHVYQREAVSSYRYFILDVAPVSWR